MATYYKKSDFEVGQEVVIVSYRWVYDTSRSMYSASRSTKELVFRSAVIEKIGRKYITVGNSRFIVDDGRIFNDINSGTEGELHPSKDAYEEHTKREILTRKIAELFYDGYKMRNVSKDTIFQIADILGIEYKGEDEI